MITHEEYNAFLIAAGTVGLQDHASVHDLDDSDFQQARLVDIMSANGIDRERAEAVVGPCLESLTSLEVLLDDDGEGDDDDDLDVDNDPLQPEGEDEPEDENDF